MWEQFHWQVHLKANWGLLCCIDLYTTINFPSFCCNYLLVCLLKFYFDCVYSIHLPFSGYIFRMQASLKLLLVIMLLDVVQFSHVSFYPFFLSFLLGIIYLFIYYVVCFMCEKTKLVRKRNEYSKFPNVQGQFKNRFTNNHPHSIWKEKNRTACWFRTPTCPLISFGKHKGGSWCLESQFIIIFQWNEFCPKTVLSFRTKQFIQF